MNNNRIQQAYISDSLTFFKEGLLSYYNLKEYNDPNAPAFFLGMYNSTDVYTYNTHKAFKVLMFGGADFRYRNSIHDQNVLLPKRLEAEAALAFNNERYTNIALKDYSRFKPIPLGNSVYMYSGLNADRELYYNGNYRDTITRELPSYPILSVSNVSKAELYSSIYPRCFCYVKERINAGNTTKWELGLMGRECIEENIVERIPQAMNNNPEEIYEATKKQIDTSGNFLNLEYWR